MTSSSKNSTAMLVRNRRTPGPARSGTGGTITRGLVDMRLLPMQKCHAIPVQVVRQPLPELEVALARGSIAPRRRDLGHAAFGERGLDRQLERELEAGGALDRDRVEEPAAVQLEVARRGMGRDAGEPVQREPGHAAHDP